jgi:hypothetical protein
LQFLPPPLGLVVEPPPLGLVVPPPLGLVVPPPLGFVVEPPPLGFVVGVGVLLATGSRFSVNDFVDGAAPAASFSVSVSGV